MQWDSLKMVAAIIKQWRLKAIWYLAKSKISMKTLNNYDLKIVIDVD